MATEKQLEMIQDLETAIKAIEAEGVETESITIGLICDRAGCIPQNVRPMVESMKKKSDRVNLSRVKRVFEKARVMPTFLDDVRFVNVEASSSEEDRPPTGKQRKARVAVSAVPEGKSEGDDLEWDAATEIRASLRSFTQQARERIIGTVSYSFRLEVGT